METNMKEHLKKLDKETLADMIWKLSDDYITLSESNRNLKIALAITFIAISVLILR